ncbi:hypothetical protein [Hufsiella ginkgonis]|uniref:Uncharacterized protein n=1 Tax=Hufsiella ginkgonis TaxID=2695274 RepID=A0A7K1XUH1_9SPHI|nr:hypothetical protein [Hufsiella ginkgonis]MXV14419.1 hypothetical protein [Hufsiella ginkgonis]
METAPAQYLVSAVEVDHVELFLDSEQGGIPNGAEGAFGIRAAGNFDEVGWRFANYFLKENTTALN